MYLDKLDKKDPAAPALLMRPSPSLFDSDEKTKAMPDTVIARLADVLPSEAPKNVAAAQYQIEDDLKKAAAYNLAKDQAALLQTAAKATNLAGAAIASGRSIIQVQGDNALTIYASEVKGVYPPLGDAASSFTKQAFSMMGTYDPKNNSHPLQLIELPEQGRLFVAQLTEVNAIWNAETYYTTAIEMTSEATRDQDEKLREGWFKLDSVTQRTGFKSTK
jgi:hypothetical protein